MIDVLTVLSTLRMEVDDELAEVFLTMEDLWSRKLWHQLTEVLMALFRDPRSRNVRFQLFTQFIQTFDTQINQQAYVTLAICASDVCKNPQESLNFLKEIAAKVDKDEIREVHTYAELKLASIYLQLGNYVQAQKILESAKEAVDSLQIADQVILAMFYGVACEYFKAKREYSQYYRNSLLYLSCIKLDTLTEEQQRQRAYDIAVGGLLGDKIYNFGELILHPILSRLTGEYKWLKDLVLAMNSGNITAFQELRPSIRRVPLLESLLPFLEQKICLMALCECVFRRPTANRILSFETIAKETHLQAASRVEILVMKAFSLGLLRGTIDQVDQTVSISWMQPRVLNHEQIKAMRDKLGVWHEDVAQLAKTMESEGQNLWSLA